MAELSMGMDTICSSCRKPLGHHSAGKNECPTMDGKRFRPEKNLLSALREELFAELEKLDNMESDVMWHSAIRGCESIVTRLLK